MQLLQPILPWSRYPNFFCDHHLQHRHLYHFLLIIDKTVLIVFLKALFLHQCKNIIVSAPESLRGQKELPYLPDLGHVWGRTL